MLLGNPVHLMLTPGQAHDLAWRRGIDRSHRSRWPDAGKAFDADPFIDTLNGRAITPVIPPKVNRKIQPPCDSRSTANATSSSASLINSSTIGCCYTLRTSFARNFLAGVQDGVRYDLAQLKTGSSGFFLFIDGKELHGRRKITLRGG